MIFTVCPVGHLYLMCIQQTQSIDSIIGAASPTITDLCRARGCTVLWLLLMGGGYMDDMSKGDGEIWEENI